METGLRPLTLGEILDRTAQLYRTNFVLFAGIAAVMASAVMVVGLVTAVISQALHMTTLDLVQSWWYRVAEWVAIPAMLVFSEVATAANNRAVAWIYLGEHATISTAYRSIVSQLRRYLWIGVVKLAVAWSPVMVLYGAFQASYIYFQRTGVVPKPGEILAPGAPAAGMMYFVLVSLVVFTLMWPALIYAFFMALRYALAIPASVVEGLSTRQALRRSIELSKGSRGRILGLWALVAVIQMIAAAVTQTFFVAYGIRHHYNMPLGLRILQQIIAFGTNTLIGPILATGTSLFYFDQRVRKEGYDIEWMMQAAGLVSSSPVTVEPSNAAFGTAAAEQLFAPTPAGPGSEVSRPGVSASQAPPVPEVSSSEVSSSEVQGEPV